MLVDNSITPPAQCLSRKLSSRTISARSADVRALAGVRACAAVLRRSPGCSSLAARFHRPLPIGPGNQLAGLLALALPLATLSSSQRQLYASTGLCDLAPALHLGH